MGVRNRTLLVLGAALCGCFAPRMALARDELLKDIDLGVGIECLGGYVPLSGFEAEFSPEIGAELGAVFRFKNRFDLTYTYGKVGWYYSTIEGGIGGLFAAIFVGGGSYKEMEIEMHQVSLSYRFPIKETTAAAFLMGGIGASMVTYSQGGSAGYLDSALHTSDQPLWPASSWKDRAPSIRLGGGVDLKPWKRLHTPVSLTIYKAFTEPKGPGLIRLGIGLEYFFL